MEKRVEFQPQNLKKILGFFGRRAGVNVRVNETANIFRDFESKFVRRRSFWVLSWLGISRDGAESRSRKIE